MPLPIKIHRLDSSIPMPEYKTAGAVAFDIAVREAVTIDPGETKLVPTGLVVCVPEGYALILTARSSNAKKGLPLANGIGIIDQDFCGPTDELYIALHNVKSTPYQVEKGERLAQGIFVPFIRAEFEESEVLQTNNRGGFGTTG